MRGLSLIPNVWGWGWLKEDSTFVTNIVSVFGVFFLAILPIYAPVGAVLGTFKVISLYAQAEATEVNEFVDRESREQARAEDELKSELHELNDSSGIVPLLRYSRVQMKAYYRLGLTQAQRSFRYSVIAMWIGFAVILVGILLQVVEVELLNKIGVSRPDTNVNTLVILSGAIIEVVSALFLWIYRNATRQLNHFYSRQMYNHGVVMCYRIAATMDTTMDETKKSIIEKMLDKQWSFDPSERPSGQALLSFGKKEK